MPGLALPLRRLMRSRIAVGLCLILPLLVLHFGMSGSGWSLHIPLLPQPDKPGSRVQSAHKHGSAGGHGHNRPQKQKGRSHTFNPNGILEPNPKGQHPIYDLIERSHGAWQEKLDGASKTLAEAVNEYRKRYNRAPPKGFDRWWAWAADNNVQLPDEYDQIVSSGVVLEGLAWRQRQC